MTSKVGRTKRYWQEKFLRSVLYRYADKNSINTQNRTIHDLVSECTGKAVSRKNKYIELLKWLSKEDKERLEKHLKSVEPKPGGMIWQLI